ncbi:AraC-type DNA-binding protein [Paenibacillus uliginis N3/975]|uniref:AraC-type DNA-binding protein n=1 Tax=Paenibacillus uliginis N3/975 TaxID=1313296 RepID=A0A1X7HS38_9BACL|nr:AraC family transcriptional regulator [Paenibacillus uliginis]SMF90901.1 AraC-type DNA-binding protein [Paenibacillus uliginis N3/975]
MKFFYQNWQFDSELPMTIFSTNNIRYHAHCHPEVELIYVVSGSLFVGVNEDKRLVSGGQFVVCGSNDIHYYENSGTDSNVIILIFKPDLLGALRVWPSEFQFSSPYLTDSQKTQPLGDLMISILEESTKAKPGSGLIIRGMILQLCGSLQRCIPSLPKDKEPHEQRARMQKILSYIEGNCCSEITLDSISRHFNMDPHHFSRTFKSTLGISFKTYLNTVRISLTEIQLETTDASITDIALDCGFTSIRTFNRVYKSLKGRTPSDLRKGD